MSQGSLPARLADRSTGSCLSRRPAPLAAIAAVTDLLRSGRSAESANGNGRSISSAGRRSPPKRLRTQAATHKNLSPRSMIDRGAIKNVNLPACSVSFHTITLIGLSSYAFEHHLKIWLVQFRHDQAEIQPLSGYILELSGGRVHTWQLASRESKCDSAEQPTECSLWYALNTLAISVRHQ